MMFILLLFLAAFSIAGSAGYFSVYGLANTFHGTFWSVIIMGGSLEYGKLVAASYLYRYWKKSPLLLNLYALFGIAILMVLTSMGIFGYLSTGYQMDALPLKQLEQQVKLLDDEKIRSINRKQQIDNQIANLPTDYSKSRIKLMNSFKAEQEQVTNRITELDKQTLELKTKVIQTEAHIGPITYIAKAFKLNTDDATKYLIYLIIFVFDPMAVALTLAVNIALRTRKEEKEGIHDYLDTPEPVIIDDIDIPEESIQLKEDPIEFVLEPRSDLENIEQPLFKFDTGIQPTKVTIDKYVPPIIPEPIPIVVEQPYIEPPPRRIRPYAGVDTQTSLDELLQQFKYYKTKEDQGDLLTPDDNWAYQAVKSALQTQGYNIYI